jgi:cytochrome c553/uncharacterized small protein (DUF1192 family)
MPASPSSLLRGLAAGLIALSAIGAADAPAAAKAGDAADRERLEFFEKRIRPVLVEQCYKCHSDQARKLKGDLKLDSLAAMIKGGTSKHPAIVPGKPDESLVIKAMRYVDDDLQMPPKAKLDDQAISDMATWIAMGAPFPEGAASSAAPQQPAYVVDAEQAKSFWSFQPVKDPPPPAVKQAGWPLGDIDRFVLAKLEDKGLTPAPVADRRTLIRRATFDLTGLPPTPEEIDAFLADPSPNAFATVVDRLLASPRYGERWGRHWLDLVRYADTAGESADYPVPQAHLYRDYVIQAFNDDKPYDRFLTEQLAGDLLPAADEEQRKRQVIATGYVAIARRFSVNPESAQHLTIEDTIDTLGRSVLGLTVGCARCHDHKFDPIPTTDYYALYGIFDSTRYPFPGSEEDRRQHGFVPTIAQSQVDEIVKPFKERIAAIDAEIKRLQDERTEVKQADKQADGKPAAGAEGAKLRTREQIKHDLEEARKRRTALLDEMPPIPDAYAVAEGDGHDVHVQKRGEPDKQGELAPRGFLSILGGQRLPSGTTGSGRLQLAGWLTDRTNPLTARVLVNRLWQHHFGAAIVATPSDFGTRGRPPTNPALLDHLASRFMAQGWSIKAMHRAIMNSRVYQLASAGDQRNLAIDAVNESQWRFNRLRLDAEEVRDALLAVSGRLDLSPAGAHPFPAQKTWNFTQHAQFSAVYDSRHRSVYVMQQRIKKHPFFAVFDGADTSASTAERLVSTTPLQALYLMNDPFVFAQSEAFAERVAAAHPGDERGQVAAAYPLALGRPATAAELDAAVAYLARFRETAGGAIPAKHPELSSYLRAVFASNEFMFID